MTGVEFLLQQARDQGLPDQITDPLVLARIAAILRAAVKVEKAA